MAITRLSIDGYGARRAGSFAGKAVSSVAITTSLGGGGVFWPGERKRTKQDVEADRIRLGILPKPAATAAVEKVAIAAISAEEPGNKSLSEPDQVEMLARLLSDSGYQVALNDSVREMLADAIRAEIEQQQEEHAVIMLMMAM